MQIAEIDATDETAPYVAKTYRWDPSEPVATRPLALTLWTREGTERETLYYAHDLRKSPPWKATWPRKIPSASLPNTTTKALASSTTTTAATILWAVDGYPASQSRNKVGGICANLLGIGLCTIRIY
nr:hypothetical protein [Akkermansia glycaniphila]